MCVVGYAILRLAGCSQVARGDGDGRGDRVVGRTARSRLRRRFRASARCAGDSATCSCCWRSCRRANGRWEPAVRIGGAVIVGISSIWSFEVFVYTGATYRRSSSTGRRRCGPPKAGCGRSRSSSRPAAAACVVAHLALRAGPSHRKGSCPSGALTSRSCASSRPGPTTASSRRRGGWASGRRRSYFRSAVGVAAIVTRLPRFEAENRTALVAIAGLAVFAVAAFTYGVRFSTEDYVARWDLPVVVVMALWIHLAGRSRWRARRERRIAATGFWLAALLIVAGWDNLGARGRALAADRGAARKRPLGGGRGLPRLGQSAGPGPVRGSGDCCSTATGPVGRRRSCCCSPTSASRP